MAYQQQRASDKVGVSPSARPSSQTTAYLQSKAYYTQIGYPQYGGLYATPNIPKGYEIATVKETVKTTQLSGAAPKTTKSLQFVLMPEITEVWVGKSYFGPQFTRPPTPAEKANLKARYLAGENIFQSGEERAMTGLGLALIPVPIITAPTLLTALKFAVPAASAVGIGEAYKVSTTGKHLTVGEAVGLAGITELGVSLVTGIVQSGPIRGRVQSKIDAAYEQQFKLNEAILMDKPMPQNIEGMTGLSPWSPTIGQKIAMKITGAAVKVPAISVNVVRVPNADVPFNMAGFQRMQTAEDLFDFSFSPKGGLVTQYVAGPEIITPASKFPLSPIMFDWAGFADIKADMATAELNAEMKQRLIDQGIPENQLDIDYGGPLSFKKTPVTKPSEIMAGPKNTIGLDLSADLMTGDFNLSEGIGGYNKAVGRAEARYGKGGGIVNRPNLLSVLEKPIINADVSVSGGALSRLAPLGLTTKSPLLTGFNPAVWQGSPFYRQTTKAVQDEIVYPLSYPASSLAHPTKLSEIAGFGSKADLDLGQFGRMDLAQTPIAWIGLTQDVIQIPKTTTPEVPQDILRDLTIPSDFFNKSGFGGSVFGDFKGFDIGGSRRGGSPLGGWGRYKRVYPIITGEQFLKGILRQNTKTRKGGARKRKK